MPQKFEVARGLILLHRSIHRVEAFDGLYVCVLLNKRYESFERFSSRHGRLEGI